MARVAIFGDIGGHYRPLLRALIDLGLDPETHRLPEDLTVVQVGDLIHRGPDSGKVLAFVDARLREQPEQWVQLAGNHEGMYLQGAPRFQWGESLNEAGENLLRSWWADGRMKVAVGLGTEHGDILVTHAGLTLGLWRKIGEPTDVRQAVPALNALPETGPTLLWRTGRMMGGGPAVWLAGPMWAEAGPEVYASWLYAEKDGTGVPFGQVHGHSTAYWWPKKTWQCTPEVAARFVPTPRFRHLKGVIGGKPFTGIDPGFGRTAVEQWAPLVLDNARIVAR